MDAPAKQYSEGVLSRWTKGNNYSLVTHAADIEKANTFLWGRGGSALECFGTGEVKSKEDSPDSFFAFVVSKYSDPLTKYRFVLKYTPTPPKSSPGNAPAASTAAETDFTKALRLLKKALHTSIDVQRNRWTDVSKLQNPTEAAYVIGLLQAYAALHTGVVRGDASIVGMGALMALAESDGYSQDATGHLKTQQVLNIMKGIDGTSKKGTSGVAENIKHNKCKDWLDKFVLKIYWVVKS